MSQTGQNEPEEDKGPLWNLVHLNPALWIGLVVAVAAVLATFGLVITGEQREAITTLLLAVVAIAQAIWTKSQTTANKKVVVVAPDPIKQPRLVTPGAAVTDARVVDILNAAQNTPESWEARS